MLAAVALLGMGRPLAYRNGPVRLWTGQTDGPETSQQLADPYTFTHLTHGALLYLLAHLVARRRSLGARAVLATAGEAVWEVIENTPWVIERYRTQTLALGYYGDSVLNSAGDMLAAAGGFLVAALLPAWGTVLAVLGLELVLLVWIRDNLMLNVLMLLRPFDVVRRWQSRG